MKSYIFIDGPVLWVMVIVFLFIFIAFLCFGSGFFNCQRKIDQKNHEIKKLRTAYNHLIEEYYKAVFELPSEENRNVKMQ